MFKGVVSTLAVIAIAFLAAVAVIVSQVPGMRDGRSMLLTSESHMSLLSLAQTLEHRDSVPPQLALATAATMSILHSNCGGGGAAGNQQNDYADVKRNRENWRDVLALFINAQQAEQIVMDDADHTHVLIFVAPSWCMWSRKEVFELHEHFHQMGEAGKRIHLIDVDDPENARLIAWEGVSSYPTMVVVKGNHIVSKVSGFQGYDRIRDLTSEA